MDFKKVVAPSTTITREIRDLEQPVGNIYETLMIIAKRSNRISVELKTELSKKLEEFATFTDNLEEIHENREQIEISKYYERLPKPTAIALQEYIDGKLFSRYPEATES
ncbi:MAG: RNA polymerase Rpb6 [Bacteroidetes bacterium HGW-Bacteroidetes-21]|jgi:DNA-directed RNA polymerase subunit K/omega|nr:MAG: RNA polymerase Rpb6 [Bacteroidetes bacterium HGW-Bacteroidetes-21]